MNLLGLHPLREVGVRFRPTVLPWPSLLQLTARICHELLPEDHFLQLARGRAGIDCPLTCDEMSDYLESYVDLLIASHAPTYSMTVSARRLAEVAGIHQWLEFLRHCGGFTVEEFPTPLEQQCHWHLRAPL